MNVCYDVDDFSLCLVFVFRVPFVMSVFLIALEGDASSNCNSNALFDKLAAERPADEVISQESSGILQILQAQRVNTSSPWMG